MSCWVVPSVAAELWGCTVDAVLCAMRNGHVPSKDDSGWTFVDVAPDSPTLATPRSVRPATFEPVALVSEPQIDAIITAAEEEALSEPMKMFPEAQLEEQAELLEAEPEMPGDWRDVRRQVATSRRAPLAQAA